MMSFLSELFSKKKTASFAKERLQIILAHDASNKPSWLPQLQDDLVAVLNKYIKVDDNSIQLSFDTKDDVELLEINVSIPDEGQ